MDGFDAKAFGRDMAALVRDHVKRELDPLRARIAELEGRAMRYMGVHQRAQAYQRGDAVTHSGALWVAVAAVEPGDVPGRSAHWQLAVKGGAR